jgi:hypothetical protein
MENYYRQGASAAQMLFKVADILTSPGGRKLVNMAVQTLTSDEGKPRIVRSLEPYVETYLGGDPNAFKRFDDKFRQTT